MPKTIAFDADDTLWINEPYFRATENKVAQLLSKYQSEEKTHQELYRIITQNISIYGYGVKSCILSILEYVTMVSNNIKPSVYQEIIALGKQMLQEPVTLIPEVKETLETLSSKYNLMVFTKGDLLDQECKLEKSGLSTYFTHIEIMSDKNTESYHQALTKLKINPKDFLMIGNSLKSDILPVLEIGAEAVYIPFHTIWEFETVENNILKQYNYQTLSSINKLIEIL